MKEKDTCVMVKALIEERKFKAAFEMIAENIKTSPDSAAWHNLLGILYEKQGNHVGGMKHFRAAWALDPEYQPARWNMELYGEIEKGNRRCAYLEEDCRNEIKRTKYRLSYDIKGTGHFETLEILTRKLRETVFSIS